MRFLMPALFIDSRDLCMIQKAKVKTAPRFVGPVIGAGILEETGIATIDGSEFLEALVVVAAETVPLNYC